MSYETQVLAINEEEMHEDDFGISLNLLVKSEYLLNAKEEITLIEGTLSVSF